MTRHRRPYLNRSAEGGIRASRVIEPSPAGKAAPRTSTSGRPLVLPDATSFRDVEAGGQLVRVAEVPEPAVLALLAAALAATSWRERRRSQRLLM